MLRLTPYSVTLNQAPEYLTTSYLPGTPDGQIRLVKAPFTPGPNLELADVELADFQVSTPLGSLTITWGIDPATGSRVINLGPPAGGFHWETTTTLNLPQTIYGIVYANADTEQIVGSALFDEPVVLTAINQAIDLPPINFVLNPSYMG